MDRNHVISMIWKACQGKPSRFADRYGISEQTVHEVMHGEREPTTAILDALGLERSFSHRASSPVSPY